MKAHDLARLLLRQDNYKVIINMQPGKLQAAHHAIGSPEATAGGVVFARDPRLKISESGAVFITNDVNTLVRELEEAGLVCIHVVGQAAECSFPECHKPAGGCGGCGASEAMCLASFHEKGGKCCPDCHHDSGVCGKHAY